MRTVRDIFELKRTMGRIGLEIEVEGSNLPTPSYTGKNFNRFWRVERDGSLRGESYEYVLNNPIPPAQVRTALRALEVAYEREGSRVNDSNRAGVHVHINVQELTRVQLATFCTAFLVLEEPLVRYCGKHREGNHFCLRAKDAEFMMYMLERGFRSSNLNGLHNNIIRYSAMNLNSLSQYGSVEFRSMRSTRDLTQIEHWAKMLNRLLDGSMTFDSPQELIDSMSSDGYEMLLETLVGKGHAERLTHEGIGSSILRGVRNVQDMAYSIDWKEAGSEDTETDFQHN